MSASNPFSTRYMRPDHVAFQSLDGVDGQQILRDLVGHCWRGQIVGDHGSGKSTLVAWLIPRIRSRGREPLVWRLQQRTARIDLQVTQQLDSNVVLIVDGFEQLTRMARLRVMQRCDASGSGLLVTTHRPVRMPLLVEMKPRLSWLNQIVAHLMRDQPALIDHADIRRAFEQQQGNLREAIFQLYDVWESRVGKRVDGLGVET